MQDFQKPHLPIPTTVTIFYAEKLHYLSTFKKEGGERVPGGNYLNLNPFFLFLSSAGNDGTSLGEALITHPRGLSTWKGELTVLSGMRWARCFESCQRASKLHEVRIKVEPTSSAELHLHTYGEKTRTGDGANRTDPGFLPGNRGSRHRGHL